MWKPYVWSGEAEGVAEAVPETARAPWRRVAVAMPMAPWPVRPRGRRYSVRVGIPMV